jgi:dTDP-4-dehydrorhamnose reductase
MKVLVTGSTGMLGSSMVSALQKKGYDVVTSNFLYAHMDITKENEVFTTVSLANPDIILHLAAETDVDRCEREPSHAFRVNTDGTINVAEACKRMSIPMLYVSTIGVFDGDKKEPYTEEDEPNPVNMYGLSKLRGELSVRILVKDYFIVRAGWMMGGGPTRDKKFVGKIIRQLEDPSIQSIQAVTDKVGSPTYAPDFCEVVANLICTKKYGLYHCTNHGYPSRFDVAKEVVRLMGREGDVDVLPVDSSAFASLSAGRANSEMSDNKHLQAIGLDSMPDWKDALERYIQKYWNSL